MDSEIVEREAALQHRSHIQKLEAALMQFGCPNWPLRHFFAKGLYARELTIPAGGVLTGAIHKHQHINIVVRGDISVCTELGVVRIKGPHVMVSEPGTKRAGYAHEETVWITVHAAEATTPEAAEAELVTNDFDEYERFIEEQKCLSQSPAQSSP